jgi:hypothetical protein
MMQQTNLWRLMTSELPLLESKDSVGNWKAVLVCSQHKSSNCNVFVCTSLGKGISQNRKTTNKTKQFRVT